MYWLELKAKFEVISTIVFFGVAFIIGILYWLSGVVEKHKSKRGKRK